MKEKIKCYIYTRVSTEMQTDGYSLDAQKERIKKYCDAFDYKIINEYQDAGRSGKSIEGRADFKRMLEDIKSNKDDVKYVLVFKLSRFGRNAADVLTTLQFMQDFGVNLISVEDGIDSSKDAGKLMITVLSAVAEIERENILVQTMEGRLQKARSGLWNGGFAPYGYKLVNGELKVEDDEADAIKIIFDKYVNTNMGCLGICKYLEQQGITKKPRQNGTSPYFSASFIRAVLDNPVYCGRIAFGRRKTEKVKGTRNDYKVVKQDDFMTAEGQHEALVSVEMWEEAQVKRKAGAKKYERKNPSGKEKVHLLSGILKCPICGAGMYGNKSIKKKKDGSGENYKDYWYYGCKHRTPERGHKCTYRKQINEEKLDSAVIEVISKIVSNPKFADMMQKKINMKVDTTTLDAEIANYQKQLTQVYGIKRSLQTQMDNLDVEDKHFDRKLSDLQDRLDAQYDKIEDIETQLAESKDRRKTIVADKMTGDNIYKLLIHVNDLYDKMNDAEKRELMNNLVSDVFINEDAKDNGQWLKSIKFKLPIIDEESLDNDSTVESVVLLSKVQK